MYKGALKSIDTFVPSLPSPLRSFSDPSTLLRSEYGWGRLSFHNKTHATYQFIASKNGSVLDEHTLYKEHNFGKDQGQHGKKQGQQGKNQGQHGKNQGQQGKNQGSNSQGGNNNQQKRTVLF